MLALALAGQPALADKRVALVVGNSAYTFAPLSNPLNDASDIAAALRRLRFDVMERNDLAEAKFDTALDEFEGKAKDADVALFFFSGHGVRVDKSGYLVPTGFEPASEGSALRRLIGIQETVERIEKAARVSVFVLDACRDSPLPEQLRRGGKSKGFGADKGLPLLSELGSNTFIVYATVPGETANDGAGRNSPFTAALLRHLETPGLEIQTMFTRVTADVVRETGRKQQPERLSRLQHELILLPAGSGVLAPAAPWSADAQAWSLVQNSQSEAVLEEFARRFPDSDYGGFAKARLEELRRAPTLGKSRPTPQHAQTRSEACEGLLVSVPNSNKQPCIKPGSGESFKDCRDCPEMIVAPASSSAVSLPDDHVYQNPQQTITIDKALAVGRFPVTRDEFDVFVNASGYRMEGGCYASSGGGLQLDMAKSHHSPGFYQTGTHPVVCVNWYDACAYAVWLSKKTGKDYRLLSEAEREYTARAGTETRYWGTLSEFANSEHEFWKKTLPVKSFRPNPWGLYQVYGNVWQWTLDDWVDDKTSLKTNCLCNFWVSRTDSTNVFPIALEPGTSVGCRDFRVNLAGFRVARTSRLSFRAVHSRPYRPNHRLMRKYARTAGRRQRRKPIARR